MKRLPELLAVTAVGALLVVAGCGGDDETTSASSTAVGATGGTGVALTDDEFVNSANEICAAGNEETDAAADQVFTGGEPTDEQLGQFADIFVPTVQAQIDTIRTLTPPEEIADDVTTFLDDAQDVLDDVEADPRLLAPGEGSDDPFAEVTAEADALGLDECGSNS